MSEPDWENFAKAVLTDWPTGDLDGSVLFDLSLQYGMIQEVPGGYNSDHHIDAEGICPEEGDPWYEYTFRGEAGPGLYSIADMNKRIEELEARHANDCEEIAKWREIVSGRTISENFEVVWRERLKRSEAKLAKALEALEIVSDYRKKCHDYDDDMGRDLRTFDEEDLERIEGVARTTIAELKGDLGDD